MKVVVVKLPGDAPGPRGPLSCQQDAWDDSALRRNTTYTTSPKAKDDFVGNIKILRRGQVETPSSILPEGPLDPLDENFCSLGQSLDYYERLAAFPEVLRGVPASSFSATHWRPSAREIL